MSRSSALASKATGYPLAFIAAKLVLGYGLTELKNIVTQETSACFEPALDYIVLKYPRWDLQKFEKVSSNIDSEMKSVGEVMAIGRSYEEVLQKAIRMLDIGMDGLVCNNLKFSNLDKELAMPTGKRMFAISEAIERGYSIEKIYRLFKVNPWFLYKMKNIVDIESKLREYQIEKLPLELFKEAKQKGFSDLQIAILTQSDELKVRKQRKKLGIIPCVKQIDTLAAEYPAKTNYLYLTYNGFEDDLDFKDKKQVIVLGGGAYRIGSSVEFDWCCVNSVKTLKDLKYNTIMINYNPETVSTNYDICDKLYFDELKIDQPEWEELNSLKEAENFANKVGYPVMIRSSYVLSGAAMSIALNKGELKEYLKKASDIGQEHPVVISKFITGAKEIEIDAVANKGELVCHAISEHVE